MVVIQFSLARIAWPAFWSIKTIAQLNCYSLFLSSIFFNVIGPGALPQNYSAVTNETHRGRECWKKQKYCVDNSPENVDHNERVSLSRTCSSRKRNHSCLFLWWYQWRITTRSQENCHPTPSLQREHGVHSFSSGKRACLGYLNSSIGLRNDIIPIGRVWLDFVLFLERESATRRMTDCSEKKIR